MTEEKTRIKKIIENGAIKFRRVPITDADIIVEKDAEIKRLHELIDSLRARIEQLEEEQQRQHLIDKEAGPVESYNCYF